MGRAATRSTARRRIDPPRLIAWRTLRAVAVDDSYANLVLPGLLREAGLQGRDAAFATELAYGALRGRGTYDAVIAACSNRPLDEIDPAVLDALRLGAHQLLATRVPAHAAVAATVDLVRAEIGQGAAGFANAVLRSLSGHDLSGWLERLLPAQIDEDARLALTHSHPTWIVRALRDALVHHGRSAAELEQALAADNLAPEVTLVALPGLSEPAELADRDRPSAPIAASPLAVRVTGSPAASPAVRQGRARVQDAGSQHVALALVDAATDGTDAGQWLDLCAGPGGKSALLSAVLLQRRRSGELPADARVLATEVAGHRARLVADSVEGVRRAAREAGEADPVRVEVLDGRWIAGGGAVPQPGFDRVLVDAPCTGLGALRRRPEARWRRRPGDLAALGPLQRDLLRAALDVVRPGGVVAYVTCSPHPAETTLVLDDVLRRPEYAGSVERAGPDVQLWPHVDGTDAMYLALLRRVPSSADRSATAERTLRGENRR